MNAILLRVISYLQDTFFIHDVSKSYIFKRLTKENSSWDSAQQYCNDMEGRLVRLKSEEEWQLLIELSDYQLGNHLFIFIDVVCENPVGIIFAFGNALKT